MKRRILIGILFLTNILLMPLVSSTTDIDPLTFYSENDAYISQKNHDTSHGLEKILKITSKYGGSNWTLWRNDLLVSFDLSSLPSNVYIISAKLYLYYYDYVDNDPAGRSLSAYRIGESWDEETVTWDDCPTNAGTITINATVPNKFGWMNWNVTTDVQNYVDDVCNNYGWQICDKNSWGMVGIPTPLFYPKESDINSPYIKVEYALLKPNNPPVADPGGPYSAYVNTSLIFNGDNSSDTYGNITGYRWDFNNDSTWDTNWMNSSTTNHTYNSTGNYTVVIQVKDDRNGNSTNSTWANITLPPNKLPTANFTYNPYYPITDENVTFTDISNDSDGTIISWHWTFGDGTNSTSQNPIHIYDTTGNYTVNLTITDDRNDTDNFQRSIVVRDFIRGDINDNGTVDIDDLVYLIRYIFSNGPEPDPIYVADINGDGEVNYKDLFFY